MSLSHKNCLVLNADYSPIGIINWQKAMIWLFKYSTVKRSIEILEYHDDDYVMACSGATKIPSIIRTQKYFRLNKNKVNFSRKNLFLRDNFTCQYCDTKLAINQLTYDHVIPKSQWSLEKSPTSWTNVVTACRKCNMKKGNKTPVQAGMALKTEPYIPLKSPKYLPIHSQLSTISESIPDSWTIYLYK